MKKLFYLQVVLVALLGGCSNDPEPEPAPPPVPEITAVSPLTGTVDTEVTITGTGFETTSALNTVKFNGALATLSSATSTQIVAKVPLNAGTGAITVSTAGGTAEGPVFTYVIPPTITSVDPLSGPFDTSVVITGTNFSASGANTIVKINGKIAVITSATSTQLVITVPVGAGTGKVSVETSGVSVDGPVFDYILSAVVTTFAGDGVAGFADGTGAAARFAVPSGLALDDQENILVADRTNNRIRKITPAGVVTTIAGNGENLSEDGNGTSAKISRPTGVFYSQSTIYFTEGGAAKVRKIAANGDVTTIAGSGITGYVEGAALTAQFSFPTAVVKDSQGNLFIADFVNSVIRKITDGVVSTFAGDGSANFSDGTGTAAQFSSIWGIAIDANDNLYVSDWGNHKIRKITPSAVVTTLAGSDIGFEDGPAATSRFNLPYGVAIDKDSNIFIADADNGSIRKLTVEGNVETIAGNGTSGAIINGIGTAAQFSRPTGIVVNSKGEIYVSDFDNGSIRKIVIQ